MSSERDKECHFLTTIYEMAAHQTELPLQPALLTLRDNQQQWTRLNPASLQHELQCDLCREWIRLSGRVEAPSTTALYQHRGSKRCDLTRRRLERSQATQALEDMPEYGRAPPTADMTSDVDVTARESSAHPVVSTVCFLCFVPSSASS